MDNFIKILADPRNTLARGGSRTEWSKFILEAPWQISAPVKAETKQHATQGGQRPVGAFSSLGSALKLQYKLTVTTQTIEAIEDLLSVEHLKCRCYFNPVSKPLQYLEGHLAPDGTDLSPLWSSLPDLLSKIQISINVALPASDVAGYL